MTIKWLSTDVTAPEAGREIIAKNIIKRRVPGSATSK